MSICRVRSVGFRGGSARFILSLLLVAIFLVVGVPTAAYGVLRHRPLPPFGPVESPSGVTVNQSNGNVYVAAASEHSINIFRPKGLTTYELAEKLTGSETPQGAFAMPTTEPAPVAVDSKNGDLYVVDPGHKVVDKFNTTTGKYVCQFSGVGRGCHPNPEIEVGGPPTFEELTGVTVDAHENVYVSEYANKVVDEFAVAGTDMKQITGCGIGRPSGLGIDSNEVLYVQNYFSNVVACPPGSVLDSSTSYDVAVDPLTNNVYVDHGSSVSVYGPAPTNPQLDTFNTPANPGDGGVAVNGSTRRVYVTDKAHSDVAVFEPVVVPDVTRCEAVVTSPTTATLVGKINPDKTTAEYFFRYGTTTSYGLETPPTLLGAGNGGESYVTVEVPVTGLATGTTYHCQLEGTNSSGVVNEGADGEFETPPAVNLHTGPPTNLTGTSATLVGFANPGGIKATCFFQYALVGEGYSSSTSEESVGAGTQEKEVTASISGLKPVTGYHYRIVCYNTLGISFGEDEPFITPPALPTVNDQAPFATGITLREATLHGTVNPGRGVTTYHFQYGPSTAYGESTPEAYTPLNYEENSGEQVITGLQPGTTYHYRLVATNSSGTAIGPDETFTTLDGTLPIVETGGASQITPNTATVAGFVDPTGHFTGYWFEVGTTQSYGTQLFGVIANVEEVAIVLTGLLPETVYHYRLVATNAAGITYGADQAFRTSNLPIPFMQPPTLPLLPIPVFPIENHPPPPPVRCKKGFVRKGSKCVRKHHKPARKRHRK
jgi:hypothetical protein